MVSRHLPDPSGTAAGRALHALGEGLVAAGHDLDVWSWWFDPPTTDLPAWCRWEPLPGESALRTRARALVRPRSDVVRMGWAPRAGSALAVADDPVSFAAVDRHTPSILTVHYGVGLDARALRVRSPRAVQDLRAERRFARRADGVVAYSRRVADALVAPAVVAPIACPCPSVPLPPSDELIVACVADWTWPPNAWSARCLLAAWPGVQQRVPGARLDLAGRGSDAYDGASAGVRGLGRVDDALDVLGPAAVVAFPCPPTSGPKVKVLEAMAVGRAVVTTSAGGEGIMGVDGIDAPPVAIADADPAAFGAAIADLLLDGDRRRRQSSAARALVEEHHAPGPAAARRVQAWDDAVAAPRR